MRRRILASVVLAAALAVSSCSLFKGEQRDPVARTSAELRSFVDSYFSSYFNFNPSEGTSAGLHEYDTKLEDRSVAAIRARVNELQAQSSQIAELRKLKMRPEDSIDAELIANRINAELLDLDTIRVWRSPLYYAGIPGGAIDLLIKRNFAPPGARLKDVTARLRQIPALLDACRDNSLEPPKEFVDLAIRIVKGSIPFFRDTIGEWGRNAADKDVQLRAEFDEANRKVIAALELTAEHLQANVLPLANGKYAIGAENFSRKLQYEELVDIPLDQLLKIGEDRLARDHQAFIETAKIVAPGRSPMDAVSVLEAQHPTADKLMDFAKSTLEETRAFVVQHSIIPIPSEERARIEPTPPYARSGTFASMDTPGPYETTAKEAFYYVTPVEPDWTPEHKEEHLKLYNRPVMSMITIHEAYPGHYVQFLYAKQFPTKARKLISCGTNAEGWAHYAEQMMLEEGFGNNDPKMRLAQLSEALVRDARYVSGIKLHTAGWTVDEATKLFVEQAFMQKSNAFEEARRGTYNPTYLYYTLGKMQIYKLREDYKKAKGSAYALGKFHEEFVKQGSIPISLIRRILLPGDKSPTL